MRRGTRRDEGADASLAVVIGARLDGSVQEMRTFRWRRNRAII